jgi:hypothetical protein
MPYIKPEARNKFEAQIDHLIEEIENPGELNYVITRLARAFAQRDGTSYAKINETMGALECAKLELYRRIAEPYEDKKIKENGDVVDPQA